MCPVDNNYEPVIREMQTSHMVMNEKIEDLTTEKIALEVCKKLCWRDSHIIIDFFSLSGIKISVTEDL